jgi:hypothetical protein
MLMRSQEMCVLHVVEPGDAQALETLRDAARVLASAGVAQLLLVLDRRRGAQVTRGADVPVEIEALPCAGRSLLGVLRMLRARLLQLCHERTVYAVHLHGIVSCFLGTRALAGPGPCPQVVFSPHLRCEAPPWTTTLVLRLARHSDLLERATVTAAPWDAEVLSKLFERSAEVLPPPVREVFFAAPRQEGTRPRVLICGVGDAALTMATRLCVLLNGREARVSFSWLGGTDEAARRQLSAAGIEELPAEADAAKARCLSAATAFVHISPGERPLRVAEAMAAGVTCLVSDSRAHRALVRHGENGLVCTTERDFLDKLVLLLRDRGERQRLGAAARVEARLRFTERHFQNALLRAYGFVSHPASPEHREERHEHPIHVEC